MTMKEDLVKIKVTEKSKWSFIQGS